MPYLIVLSLPWEQQVQEALPSISTALPTMAAHWLPIWLVSEFWFWGKFQPLLLPHAPSRQGLLWRWRTSGLLGHRSNFYRLDQPQYPSISTQDFPRALKWPSSGFPISLRRLVLVTGDITNWPLFSPVYPSLPHGNRWFCWFNRRWTQGYSRAYPFKIAKNQILSILSPHRVLTLHVNKRWLTKIPSIRFSSTLSSILWFY